MKWYNHIEYIINKTKYLIFIFAKLRKYMDIDTLMKMYYVFFHSIISYRIIAWGGVYKTTLTLLQNIQTKILKVIKENHFSLENPLNVKQIFALESIMFHYDKLKQMYSMSESITRNKNLLLPKMNKAISDKNSYTVAIKVYNTLPNNLKSLTGNKTSIKAKLKEWVKNNM